MKIGILGTGIVGETLGTAIAARGHDVKMGSRSAGNEKAAAWRRGAACGRRPAPSRAPPASASRSFVETGRYTSPTPDRPDPVRGPVRTTRHGGIPARIVDLLSIFASHRAVRSHSPRWGRTECRMFGMTKVDQLQVRA